MPSITMYFIALLQYNSLYADYLSQYGLAKNFIYRGRCGCRDIDEKHTDAAMKSSRLEVFCCFILSALV